MNVICLDRGEPVVTNDLKIKVCGVPTVEHCLKVSPSELENILCDAQVTSASSKKA